MSMRRDDYFVRCEGVCFLMLLLRIAKGIYSIFNGNLIFDDRLIKIEIVLDLIRYFNYILIK